MMGPCLHWQSPIKNHRHDVGGATHMKLTQWSNEMKEGNLFPLCGGCLDRSAVSKATTLPITHTRCSCGERADALVGPLPSHPVMGGFRSGIEGPVLERQVVLDELPTVLLEVFECLDPHTSHYIEGEVVVDTNSRGFVLRTKVRDLPSAILQCGRMK